MTSLAVRSGSGQKWGELSLCGKTSKREGLGGLPTMKHLLVAAATVFVLSIVGALVACGGGGEKAATPTPETATPLPETATALPGTATPATRGLRPNA